MEGQNFNLVLPGGLNQLYMIPNSSVDCYEILIEKFNNKELTYEFIENALLQEIFQTCGQIYLIYDSPQHLEVDNKILSEEYGDLFEKSFVLIFKDDFMNQQKNPKNYMIFHYDLEMLLEFNKLGYWTCYLTIYIFTNITFTHKTSKLNIINAKNSLVLTNEGKFFQFSTHVFHQLRNYFKIIANYEGEKSAFDQFITDKISPIKVLMFYRTLFKKKELLKSKHYTSTEKVLYISNCVDKKFTPNLNLDLNGSFDIILYKFSMIQEIKEYQSLLNEFDEYESSGKALVLNSTKNISNFFEREKMINFMKDFCDNHPQISKEYSVKLPKCFSFPLKDVYTSEQLKEILDKTDLKLPLIIKYSGPDSKFNHLLVQIITEAGIENYTKFFQDYSKSYNIEGNSS